MMKQQRMQGNQSPTMPGMPGGPPMDPELMQQMMQQGGLGSGGPQPVVGHSVGQSVMQSIEPSDGECALAFRPRRRWATVESSSGSESDQGRARAPRSARFARSYRGLTFTPEYHPNERGCHV
jgi:hypothetical protein